MLSKKEFQRIKKRYRALSINKQWTAIIAGRDYDITVCYYSFLRVRFDDDIDIFPMTDDEFSFIVLARKQIPCLMRHIYQLKRNLKKNVRSLTKCKSIDEIKNELLFNTKEQWTPFLLKHNKNYKLGLSTYSTFKFAITLNGNKRILKMRGATRVDYNFIVHAKKDVISLLEEIERLNEKLLQKQYKYKCKCKCKCK